MMKRMMQTHSAGGTLGFLKTVVCLPAGGRLAGRGLTMKERLALCSATEKQRLAFGKVCRVSSAYFHQLDMQHCTRCSAD